MGLFGPSKKQLKYANVQLQSYILNLEAEVKKLNSLLLPEQRDVIKLNETIDSLNAKRFELDSEISGTNAKISQLSDTISSLNKEISDKKAQLFSIGLELEVQEYGVYSPNYVFANSDLYKAELTKVRELQKQSIRNDTACSGNNNWTVNNSESKGRAMVKDMKKLLLRAFNVECDDIVNNIKVSNFDKSVERIYKISEQISKLGAIMSISINNSYIELKIEEVKLALDFQQKKQEEKEKLKEMKEQQREEARVQKELEEERKKLIKEQTHYYNALNALISQIESNGETPELLEKKAQLEYQINEATKAIENVDYREANKKAGYVYIISNIGAFGNDVYKIGMTRRLDPQERIDELGDASVPFNFDVHALIFSDDAPKLESALHNAFENKKLNRINLRREFFKVSLDEIKAEVRKNFDKTVEWVDVPEADQYRQSLSLSNK